MTAISTETEWARSGIEFRPRSRADISNKLPPGVYKYVATMVDWWLERTHDEFEFSFKVYSASENVIKRITTFWKKNRGNLGVLMNGLRGAGKTMTSQLLANRLIKELGIPVLVVRGPVPLQTIFDVVQQDMMVIFDEFEKTHDKEHQQMLLSTIDGMSRSSHARLIVFTTNNPEIEENFKDRPSRIHYTFEFNRVADEIIEGLIDDSLPDDLKHLKQDILDFLQTRYICTIDIVKAVIAEVKTFRESPLEFEGLLNISKGEPPSFTVDIINPKTNKKTKTVSYFFKPDDLHLASMMSGGKRAIEAFKEANRPQLATYNTYEGVIALNLLEKTDEEGCWLAEIGVPKAGTPFAEFPQLWDGGYTYWMDNRPKDWNIPYTNEMVSENPTALKGLIDLYKKSQASETIYGTGEKAVFKIKITPNREPPPSRWKVTAAEES